uniref:Ovule protein n=1 Tax=Haemonchus contortus TaxID=6289 RepID=A0A7I4YTF0_HAECO
DECIYSFSSTLHSADDTIYSSIWLLPYGWLPDDGLSDDGLSDDGRWWWFRKPCRWSNWRSGWSSHRPCRWCLFGINGNSLSCQMIFAYSR